MGLDMNIIKVNRKVNSESELRNLINIDYSIQFFKNATTLDSAKEVIRLYENKDFDTIISNHTNEHYSDLYFKETDEDQKLEYVNRVVNDIKKHLDIYNAHSDSDLSFTNLAYFRKHSDLHGYFEDMYIQNGGEESFNCIPLILEEDDLKNLLNLINLHLDENNDFSFKKAAGFFWGKSSNSEWAKTKEKLSTILKDTNFDEETVYYTSWW